MAAQEKRDASVLGLGFPAGKDDPSAWRPSKVNEERLSSLSPRRHKGFRMPRWVRPLLTIVFAVCLAYVFGKLWFEPEADQLHPELAIFIGALILVIVTAAVSAVLQRRRRKLGDEQSMLRL